MILVIVAVSPGFGAGPLGLLDLVAFAVVAVGPGAIAREPVAGAGLVAGHRAVAVGVVGVGGGTVVGQLVGGVVRVCLGAAVERVGQYPAGQVVSVRVVGQEPVADVLVLEVAEPAGGIMFLAIARRSKPANHNPLTS